MQNGRRRGKTPTWDRILARCWRTVVDLIGCWPDIGMGNHLICFGSYYRQVHF